MSSPKDAGCENLVVLQVVFVWRADWVRGVGVLVGGGPRASGTLSRCLRNGRGQRRPAQPPHVRTRAAPHPFFFGRCANAQCARKEARMHHTLTCAVMYVCENV